MNEKTAPRSGLDDSDALDLNALDQVSGGFNPQPEPPPSSTAAVEWVKPCPSHVVTALDSERATILPRAR
ncbi:MAG: hypothetical protein H6983_04320 [Ectothiorhodospiraceae bacterium]|nr:hypothetical protein [Ectothiorhodospiraceae bacterium]